MANAKGQMESAICEIHFAGDGVFMRRPTRRERKEGRREARKYAEERKMAHRTRPWALQQGNGIMGRCLVALCTLGMTRNRLD